MATLPEPLVLVLREPGHASLMADKARAFAGQRQVLRELRSWLREEVDAGDLARLCRPAPAQQYLREARYWGGLRALGLCLRATLRVAGGRRVWGRPGAGWRVWFGRSCGGASDLGARALSANHYFR